MKYAVYEVRPQREPELVRECDTRAEAEKETQRLNVRGDFSYFFEEVGKSNEN